MKTDSSEEREPSLEDRNALQAELQSLWKEHACLKAEQRQLRRLLGLLRVKAGALRVLVKLLGTVARFTGTVPRDGVSKAAAVLGGAGMSPGNDESAGKRKSGRTPKGNHHLRQSLIQAGHCAGQTHGIYLSAQYKRIATRRGIEPAGVAVDHTTLIIFYYMIKDGTEYRDLGSDYFDKMNEQRTVKRALERLEALGYKVTLTREISAA